MTDGAANERDVTKLVKCLPAGYEFFCRLGYSTRSIVELEEGGMETVKAVLAMLAAVCAWSLLAVLLAA